MQVAQQDLLDLVKDGRTLVLSNQQDGITVFFDDVTRVELTWKGKGDPDGGDVKQVPSALLNNPVFCEQIQRGLFRIENSTDQLSRSIQLQQAAWTERQDKAAHADAELQKQQEETVVAVGRACIAPKGGAMCGSYAIVAGKDSPEEPPLCDEHAHLASQYESSDTGRTVNGKPEVIWKRRTPSR